jgi:hypothetical protein
MRRFAKKVFAPEDDRLLRELANSTDNPDWFDIAERMPHGFTARQCRERWKHYLSPSVCRDSWSEADDATLMSEYTRLGNKWAALAARFKGRSPDAVRNRVLLLHRRNGFPLRAPDRAVAEIDVPLEFEDPCGKDLWDIAVCDSSPFCLPPE